MPLGTENGKNGEEGQESHRYAGGGGGSETRPYRELFLKVECEHSTAPALLGWEMAEDFGVGGAVAALGDYIWGGGVGDAAAD